MLLLIGCHKVPDRKMFWETPPPPSTPDTFGQAMSDSMACDKFERILQSLHLCHNEQLDR